MTPPSLPILRSPRVQLRLLTPDDCDAFIRGAARSRDLHGSWVSPPCDSAGYEASMARVGPSYAPLGVFAREDGGLVGAFNFSQIFLGFFCSAYLGYFVFEPYAGRGLMCEGLELTVHMGFQHLSLHRIEANIQPANAQSIALVRRCGFEQEGLSPGYLFIAGAWRDHERWAIRREIWTPRRDTQTL